MRASAVGGVGLVLAAAVGLWGCGGSASAGNTLTSPSPSPGSGGAATTIAIVGIQGSRSFNPNPANVGNGSTVAWRNTDAVTHHIVSNDGTFDTGDITPGASSATIQLNSNGANYHCTIHPSMVGSINSSTGQPPPCTGLYCG